MRGSRQGKGCEDVEHACGRRADQRTPWADVTEGCFRSPDVLGPALREGEWSDWMSHRPRATEPPHAAWGSSLYAMWEDRS